MSGICPNCGEDRGQPDPEHYCAFCEMPVEYGKRMEQLQHDIRSTQLSRDRQAELARNLAKKLKEAEQTLERQELAHRAHVEVRIVRALQAVLRTKTSPRLVDAIIEDVREELHRGDVG